MAYFSDRVKETTTTTGTGNITLAGAVSGFETFNTAFGTSVNLYYAIVGTTEWEVGLGHLSASTTLVRDTVLASSNSDTAVNFSSGTKQVFCDLPAAFLLKCLLSDGTIPLTANWLLTSAALELQFRSSANKIWSSGSGILDIVAGTLLNLGADGNISLFGSTLRVIGPAQDRKADRGTSSAGYNNDYVAFIFLGAGTSTGYAARVGGTLNVNTTAAGNVGTGEDDLITNSVPANTLSTNGMYLKFRARFTIANTVNAKRIRGKFGATTFFDTGAAGITVSTAFTIVVEGTIIRTGSATQIAACVFSSSGASLVFATLGAAPAETLSGAVTLKFTGEATSNNDIVQDFMVTEYGAYS